MRFTIAPRVKFDPCVWHTWFAWYPVEVKTGKWVWLENVVRRRVYTQGHRSAPGACTLPVFGYWKYGGIYD